MAEMEKEEQRLQNVKPPMKIAPEPPPGCFESLIKAPITIHGLIVLPLKVIKTEYCKRFTPPQ